MKVAPQKVGDALLAALQRDMQKHLEAEVTSGQREFLAQLKAIKSNTVGTDRR